ncbi:MAG: TatD family hydrolase [Bacteroidota bacterium]
MELIDSHAHLNDPRFSPDLPQVLERSREAGIVAIVNVGFDLGSSRLAVAMADEHADLYAAVAVHPHDASDVDDETLQTLRELAANPKVVAVGESGLDFFRNLSPPQVQRKAFEQFIGLSAGVGKPLIVHCREAQDEVLKVLDANLDPAQTVVMHCFAGGMDFAEQCLQRGFHLGMAGTVTYPKSQVLRQVVAVTPAERLLIETDCPWLPPQGHRGERNEPAYIFKTLETVAAAREMAVEETAALTTSNARRVFGL